MGSRHGNTSPDTPQRRMTPAALSPFVMFSLANLSSPELGSPDAAPAAIYSVSPRRRSIFCSSFGPVSGRLQGQTAMQMPQP